MAIGTIKWLTLIILVANAYVPINPNNTHYQGSTDSGSISLGYSQPDRQEVVELIRYHAQLNQVDVDLALRIARAESQFKILATNKNSTAKGLFQILDGTAKHFKCSGSMLEAEANITCAMKIMSQSGYHHWNASARGWLAGS